MCFSALLVDLAFSCLERPYGHHEEEATFTCEHCVITLKGLPVTWQRGDPSMA